MSPQTVALVLCAVALSGVPQSAASALQLPIVRYFLNQSLVQRQYPCSREELECFKAEKLLFEGDGACYAAGERGPCAEGEVFHADKAEASRKGGHLRGICSSPCGDAARSPVAATGQCLTRKEVEQQICRADLYLAAARDVFGEWVCEWTQLPCAQPERGAPFKGQYDFLEYNGLCFAPNAFWHYGGHDRNVTVPDEPPSDHPALKYFTNKTYLEREYPCTEQERECLQYGRLLHSDGRCYVPGQWSSACNGSVFHLDFEAANRGDGVLQGTCSSPCDAGKQPNVATGVCEDFGSMINSMCRWEWGFQTMQNEFAQMACQCGFTAATVRPQQPTLPPPASGPGLCRAPDFSNPVRTPFYDQTLTVGFRLPCSKEQYACLREGKVLMWGACYALRSQGPCGEGYELVLNKDALARARLEGKCKTRACPEGSVLMPVVNKCLTHEQVISMLCEGQKVALDEFGGWQCDYEGGFPGNLTRVTRNDTDGFCELPEKYAIYPGNPQPMDDDTHLYNSTRAEDDYITNNTVY